MEKCLACGSRGICRRAETGALVALVVLVVVVVVLDVDALVAVVGWLCSPRGGGMLALRRELTRLPFAAGLALALVALDGVTAVSPECVTVVGDNTSSMLLYLRTESARVMGV